MQMKQHMLLHKREKESGELGEWYKAQSLIKIKCERKGPRSGAEPLIAQVASGSHWLGEGVPVSGGPSKIV